MGDQEQPFVPPPPTWSEWLPPKVTPREAITSFWSKAFTYSGRATRAEYNWALAIFVLSYLAVGALAVSTRLQGTPVGAILIGAFLLVFVVPWIALIVRRCHDMNRVGAFGLLLLATGIGFLITEGLLIFTASDPRGRRFDPGTPEAIEHRNSKRSRPLGVAACILGVLSIGAAIAPIVEIAHTSSRPVVILGNGPQHVELPTHARYGLFFDDPRNLGYSESCTAADAGRPIVLAQPGFFMTSSATENLDLVFSTGSGHLIIDCQSSAQQVAAKPVPNLAIILLGGGATLLLGIAAAVLAILWATRVGAHPQPQAHNCGPPQSPAASI